MSTVQQDDIFGFDRTITGLRLTGASITKDGLKATIEGATEIADIAMLDDATWGSALIGWAFRLTGGELREAEIALKREYRKYWEAEQARMARQLDEQIGFARLEKDKDNERRSELIAEKIFEVFGVGVFPGMVDGWNEKDRNEIRNWLAWHILKRDPAASRCQFPPVPACLAGWFAEAMEAKRLNSKPDTVEAAAPPHPEEQLALYETEELED